MMRTTSRSKRFKLTLLSSLFVLISIPMVMYALLRVQNTDTRSSADESPPQYCTFSFPYINPQTIQAGAVVNIMLSGVAPDGEVITAIRLWTPDSEFFNTTYDEGQVSISEIIKFTSETTGSLTVTGLMTTDVSTYPCHLADSETNSLGIQSLNSAPEFTTQPTSATPGNSIVVGNTYRYELMAQDPDGDKIEYSYSFTPRADWLTMSVVKDGEDGSLTMLFEGVADTPASYLANVFIHDGYNKHLRSQSWVINVDPAENDTPVVTVNLPIAGTTLNAGVPLRVEWTATDLNQITAYKLYYSSDPGKQEMWLPINEAVSYRVNEYDVDTSLMRSGEYRMIVQAQDNQTPPAVGTGVSEVFTIMQSPLDPIDDDDSDDDDGVVLKEPQIVNINPAERSEITNPLQTISATLVAGTDAQILQETIVFKIDGIDMTQHVEMNELSDSEITIIYVPSKEYEEGEHIVDIYFEDTQEGKTSRQWSFTMIIEEVDDDQISVFGFKISKRTFWIIVIGLALIILAIAVPWVIYLIWRNSDDDLDESVYTSLPPSYSPSSNSQTFSPQASPSQTESYIAPSEYTTPEKQKTPQEIAREVEKKDLKVEIPGQKDGSEAKEINTITGGIVKNPKFQTLDQKEQPSKRKKGIKRDNFDLEKDRDLQRSTHKVQNTDGGDPKPAFEQFDPNQSQEGPVVWKPRVIIPPEDKK
jgi:hypothetical protein